MSSEYRKHGHVFPEVTEVLTCPHMAAFSFLFCEFMRVCVFVYVSE